MKTKLIALALGATVLAGGAAIAQNTPSAPPPPSHGGLFKHADTNKDGIVTRAELTASIDARFARLDANKDGKIAPEERQAARKAMREARGDGEGRRGGHRMLGGMGGRADTNKDGIVTLDEVRAGPLKLFAYVDRNNDGQVDKAESDSFREATMSARGYGGPGKHGRHGGHGRRHVSPPAGAPAAPAQ